MSDEEIIEKLDREGITLASFNKRLWAYSIDEILISVLFMIIYMGEVPKDATIEQTISIINGMFYYVVLLKVIYQAFFVWMYGATLGKIFLKIKVVSSYDFENPTVLQSINRALVRIISESFLYIGFLWALSNSKRETWHDKVAKTLVINVN